MYVRVCFQNITTLYFHHCYHLNSNIFSYLDYYNILLPGLPASSFLLKFILHTRSRIFSTYKSNQVLILPTFQCLSNTKSKIQNSYFVLKGLHDLVSEYITDIFYHCLPCSVNWPPCCFLNRPTRIPPQDLYMCYSLCLKYSSTGYSDILFPCFFPISVQCHLIRDTFPDHYYLK